MMPLASVTDLEEILSANSVFFSIYGVFSFLLSLAIYVIVAITMYKIAKRRSVDKPWMAWVPVGQLCLLGAISDHYQFAVRRNHSHNRKTLFWLQLVAIALLVFAMILIANIANLSQRIDAGVLDSSSLQQRIVIGLKGLVVLGLLLLVTSALLVGFEYAALYDLFRSCDPANSLLYLLLSIFVSITMPVFLLVVYDKDEGLPQNWIYKRVNMKK